MARQRFGKGGSWLQLTLQAVVLATTMTAAAALPAPLLSAPADDAFVFSHETAPPPPPTSFEDFSLAFYLPPTTGYGDYYAPLMAEEYALLGGPEPSLHQHQDEFVFGY